MQRIYLGFSGLTRKLEWFGGVVVLPVMFFIVIVDVMMRYLFSSPFTWSLELTEWLLLLVFALALPECTRLNGHIRMELIVSNLPTPVQAILDALYAASGIWIFYLLGHRSWMQFQYDYGLNRTSEELHLPLWFLQIALLVVSSLLVFYFTMRLLSGLLGAAQFSRHELSHPED